MLKKRKKILVCCTHTISGGPELLHQLVHELRAVGREAFICYYPFDVPHQTPSQYKKYNAPQAAFDDSMDTYFVLPEVLTGVTRALRMAEAGIWWLSVDNYFLAQHQSRLYDFYLRVRSSLWHRIPVFCMRDLQHFCQSRYAWDFLQRWGIEPAMLTDYLSEEHFSTTSASAARRDIIVYNPKKGQACIEHLKRQLPNLEFLPIENMSSLEVNALFSSAKIYADFGHHPGKDRPPREAAIAGCCVVTGRRGSASNDIDVPIPREYKLDERSRTFVSDFQRLAAEIFRNYNMRKADFEDYREMVRREPELFRKQVTELFIAPPRR